MRIIHLLQSLQIGGLEKVVVHLATGARQRGHDVEVIAYLEDGPLRAPLEAAGVNVTFLPTTAGLSPLLPLRVARHLRRARATHLHTHHLGPFLYGTPAAILAGVAHLHTEHSHEFYDTPRRRGLGRRMHRFADVVACTPEVARFHRDALGAPSTVIENGVPGPRDLPSDEARRAARARLGLHGLAPVAFAVGRLAPEKDHVALVHAFREVVARLPDAQLVIIGEGPCRAAIETAIADAGLHHRVLLLGARDDVADLLPAADILAFSSKREALPMALLEGLAAGVPFVGPEVGDLPALARAGVGVSVPHGALGATIAHLLDMPTVRRQAGAAGYALWRARFSVDVMVNLYLGRYARLA